MPRSALCWKRWRTLAEMGLCSHPARVGLVPAPSLGARRIAGLLAVLCLGVAFLGLPTGNAQLTPDTPLQQFRLPIFDEETGYRVWEIDGAQAHYQSASEIEVTTMRLRIFEEGVRVVTEITSPHAHLFPSAKRAFGKSAIRVEAPQYILTGEDWTWDGEESVVTVNRSARVEFHESLDAFLR